MISSCSKSKLLIFGFDLRCPDPSQWNLRANVYNCIDVFNYLCLYDDFNLIYSESCEKEHFAKIGKSYFKYLIKKPFHAFTD